MLAGIPDKVRTIADEIKCSYNSRCSEPQLVHLASLGLVVLIQMTDGVKCRWLVYPLCIISILKLFFFYQQDQADPKSIVPMFPRRSEEPEMQAKGL
jgi:hypothetical protein